MDTAPAQDTPPAETAATPEGGAPKIKAMRRQPCPCGSGKKFKNCHEGDPGYEVATDVNEAVVATGGKELSGPKQSLPHTMQKQSRGPSAPIRNTGTVHRRKV